ncbi:DUF655 domain-containing protein [Planktothrix agardhii 1033]|nr:DUF655 domain-containing protein [Planktothrix agardhii 1033]
MVVRQLVKISLQISLTLLLALGLDACVKTSSESVLKPRLEPLTQDSLIQVYFNHSEASVYTEPYRHISRFGDNLEQIIIDTINQSTSTIDVAVQEFRLPNIAQALVERHQAGVQVRVILENNYRRPWGQFTPAEIQQLPEQEQNRYQEFILLADLNQDGKVSPEESQQRDALIILEKAGIPIIDDTENGSKGTGLMHHKFMVVDKKKNSTNGLINQKLLRINQSFDFALFVFSAQDIVNTLERKHQNNVSIRGLIDPSFAYRFYSEGLDMMGISLVNKCRYESGNNPWKQPISTVGIPNLPEGDRLHHKFGIIDGKIVITGSHNWTEAANTQNDETLIVVENPTVASHFQREFERLYQNSALGIPNWLLTKIEKDLKACGNFVVSQTPPAKANLTTKINLNTATQEELQTLPGVGEKLAKNIIAARQKKPFTSLEDLDQVSGFGPKLLEKISDRVIW